MPKRSAGLLLYRDADAPEVLLVHPGGPFWAKRDLGAWSIPKGEIEPGEEPLRAALREIAEELGKGPRLDAEPIPLGEAVQPSRKVVIVFAAPGAFDPDTLVSTMLTMPWPPRSGRTTSFPEVDGACWFSLVEAQEKILPGQRIFLDRLEHMIHSGSDVRWRT